jgi:predicted acyl esterase
LGAETEWPLARTQWTRFYLDPKGMRLSTTAPSSDGSVVYKAMDEGLTFMTDPFTQEVEFTGPVALKLFLSSETVDPDVFSILRLFRPDGTEVVCQGALDPHSPITMGWLRASQRKHDAARSLFYRPFHPHDEEQLLFPGEIVDLDVEIWPTCVVVPAGYRLVCPSAEKITSGMGRPLPCRICKIR